MISKDTGSSAGWFGGAWPSCSRAHVLLAWLQPALHRDGSSEPVAARDENETAMTTFTGSTFHPRGIYAALVTPIASDESLDEDRLASHIEFVLDGRIHGVVPIGGCREYVNLDQQERKRVVELMVQIVRGRVPVVAGALAPSTRDVVGMGCVAAAPRSRPGEHRHQNRSCRRARLDTGRR
jgi:hypothetical protein